MDDTTRETGILILASPYPVGETLDHVEMVAKSKGMVIFLRLDQRREAEKVGLTLRPTQLLLLGNPKAGTVLMNASPSTALDLPLKVLAWQDADGRVWLGYNSPEFLQQRHHLTAEQVDLIAGLGNLLVEALK